MNRAGASALAALALFSVARPTRAVPVDFFHVAANVGGSTGGHYAVRLGDEVYHFQNDDLNLLAPERHDYEHFRWLYAVLENRTIHVARVDVPDAAYQELRGRFNAGYLAYRRQRALLAALQRDRELLEMLEHDADAATPAPLAIPGAGLFPDPGQLQSAPESPALAHLRARVAERYGEDFLAKQLVAVRERIHALRPEPLSADDRDVSPSRLPAASLRFSERYDALAQQYLALAVLAAAVQTSPSAVLDTSAGPDELSLSREEAGRLEHFADALAERLVELAGSDRPDRGFALLVGMARLQVLWASAASGRLVLLDAFPADASTVAPASVRARASFFDEIAADARARFADARAGLVRRGELTEHDFSQIEAAGNRFVELWRGLHLGTPIRIRSGTLVPSQSAPAPNLPLPILDREALVVALTEAQEAERGYRSALREVSAYHLTHHNCVTEIFRTIEAAFGRDGSIRALGGYIDPDIGWRFAPFVAHEQVIATYAVVAVGEIPSYHRARLAEMRAEEGGLPVALREDNVFTSTLYRRNDTDAFFVFFTDDALLARPFYGIANVLAGVGETALGVVTSPFDHGHRLYSGAFGIAFSLPELFLVNVRKGTFEYGPAQTQHIPLTLATRKVGAKRGMENGESRAELVADREFGMNAHSLLR